MAHSPEPWTLEKYLAYPGNPLNDDTNSKIIAADGSSVLDTECDGNLFPTDEELERIVACVNACRGLATEVLLRVRHRQVFDAAKLLIDEFHTRLDFRLNSRPQELVILKELLEEVGYVVTPPADPDSDPAKPMNAPTEQAHEYERRILERVNQALKREFGACFIGEPQLRGEP
jgi:hypothetical protein